MRAKKRLPKDDLGREVDLTELLTTFVVESETFEVPIPGLGVATFKPIKRQSELKALYASAAVLYASLPKPGTDSAKSHAWAQWLPETQDEWFTAFKISELSVTPKISQLDALKLLRAPHLMEYLELAIDENSKSLSSIQFANRVAEAKKNLTETLLSASGSDALLSPSGNTRKPSQRTRNACLPRSSPRESSTDQK